MLYINPNILEDPEDENALAGENVTLTCAAEGFPAPSYQWQRYTSAGTFENLSEETSPNLTFTPVNFSDSGQYRCIATSSINDEEIIATSANALITGIMEDTIHQYQPSLI